LDYQSLYSLTQFLVTRVTDWENHQQLALLNCENPKRNPCTRTGDMRILWIRGKLCCLQWGTECNSCRNFTLWYAKQCGSRFL